MSYEINKFEIGKNINNLIIENNLTYEELAYKLNLATPRVIYEWIKGRKNPSLQNLIQLKFLFNVNLEDILGI